jgi:predicted O-methyltransferase YrrM
MNDVLQSELPRYDYVSPGLAIIRPDAAFPEMVVGDTQVVRWPWLRRWVEHSWYTDRRNPDVGFASRDEVAILYNAARMVRGRPCLEIGSWRGWSTVHLALGSGTLDVVDPILADPRFSESVRQSCAAAGVLDAVTLYAGRSPTAVDELARTSGKKWALIFIDGDHEGEAPLLDAEAAMRHAADTAMVFFHDLVSPYVAAGLDAARNAGWRTMIYQTMQIVGVAWRGNIEPPEHTPDPNVFWTLPAHLANYPVSKWKRPTIRADGGWWPGMTIVDQRNAAMMRAQTAENATSTLLVEAAALRHEVELRDAQIADLRAQVAAQHVEVVIQNLIGRRVLLGLLRRSADRRFKTVRSYAAAARIDHLLSDSGLHQFLRSRVLCGLALRSRPVREATVKRILVNRRGPIYVEPRPDSQACEILTHG